MLLFLWQIENAAFLHYKFLFPKPMGLGFNPRNPRDYATGYYGSYLQSNKNKLQDIFPVGLPPTFGPNSLQISVNFKTDFFKIY